MDCLNARTRHLAMWAHLTGTVAASPHLTVAGQQAVQRLLNGVLHAGERPLTLEDEYGAEVAAEACELEARQRTWLANPNKKLWGRN